MIAHFRQIPATWRPALDDKNVQHHLLLSLLFFGLASKLNFHCLYTWQSRSGIHINDLILQQLAPRDFSVPIFALEYSTVIIVLISLLTHPHRLIMGIQMFAVVILMRTLSIYAFPLEPPQDMILLYDPVANFFLHTEDTFVTKDLFFSGHVSSVFLLSLVAVHRNVKIYSLIVTLLVGFMILSQHVHYSLDVAFAPVAAYASYRIVLWLHTETRFGLAYLNSSRTD